MADIFAFWANPGIGHEPPYFHRADADVFRRILRPGETKTDDGIDLECFPAGFSGRLETAPVVLLYLSPGWSPADVALVKIPAGRAYYQRRWCGDEPLPVKPGTLGHSRWWPSRTKPFGTPEEVGNKLAVLNVGAYHSNNAPSSRFLASLPSSRVALDWAQNVLFPQAVTGKRLVVCMRASGFWGLKEGERYGEGLFAPPVTRGGFMEDGPMRDTILRAARRKMDLPHALA